MSNPVIVQGTVISDPYRPPSTQQYQSESQANDDFQGQHHGKKQETRCRDPFFAALFYACVVAMVIVAVVYGPEAVEESSSNTNDEYRGYIIAAIIISLISFVVSAGGVAVMMCIPETLIKASLIFVVLLAGLWMVLAFASGNIGVGVIGAIFFAMSLCYARAVWPRIPFATVNLVTAITAIKSNLGVVIFAYLFTAFGVGWSILWGISVMGVMAETDTCDDVEETCDGDFSYGYLFLLFVAYFFGQQVVQNSVHVTVAGTVGHWWFSPSEASSCCSDAVTGSFIRTMTTSFGSICFGSLIVAILQALRALANAARANDDGGIGACIAECILSCLASIVEYFNKWAFIYVGLYGYSYMDAGKEVFTLFKNRGWEAVIADDLVGNTLFLVSLLVGAVMGAIGVVIESTSDLFEDAGADATVMSFVLGLVIGLVISSIALSTIGSGVNAVVVLFADAPNPFQSNHPELSRRMRETWSMIFPGSV